MKRRGSCREPGASSKAGNSEDLAKAAQKGALCKKLQAKRKPPLAPGKLGRGAAKKAKLAGHAAPGSEAVKSGKPPQKTFWGVLELCLNSDLVLFLALTAMVVDFKPDWTLNRDGANHVELPERL